MNVNANVKFVAIHRIWTTRDYCAPAPVKTFLHANHNLLVTSRSISKIVFRFKTFSQLCISLKIWRNSKSSNLSIVWGNFIFQSLFSASLTVLSYKGRTDKILIKLLVISALFFHDHFKYQVLKKESYIDKFKTQYK